MNTKQTKKLNKFCFHKLFSWFSKLLFSIDFYLWVLRTQFGQLGRTAGVQTHWTPPLDVHLLCLSMFVKKYHIIKKLSYSKPFQCVPVSYITSKMKKFLKCLSWLNWKKNLTDDWLVQSQANVKNCWKLKNSSV